MRLINMNCANCGAEMKLSTDGTRAYCEHCGSSVLVDDEKNHVVYDNAEDAGYQFEKGRIRAQQEQAAAYAYQQANQPKPKKKHSLLFWILLWLFLWPVALTLVIVRSEKLSKKAKIIIIAVVWILVIIFSLTLSDTGETNALTTTGCISMSQAV